MIGENAIDPVAYLLDYVVGAWARSGLMAFLRVSVFTCVRVGECWVIFPLKKSRQRSRFPLLRLFMTFCRS